MSADDAGRADLRVRYNAPATGRLDRLVRRFGPFAYLSAILVLYAVAAVVYGIALSPALWLFDQWSAWSATLPAPWRWPATGIGVGVAFFAGGFGILAIVPLANLLLPTRVRPFRGGYFALKTVPWALHNGVFYLARYTFLPYVTLTPFGPWFLRAMGMRIGRRAFINTEFISDPQLISIGDDAVIGGSVHLFAHYGGGGHLTVAPVVIGPRATLGEMATVMGDVVIGADAKILPHSVLLPGSRVGDGETWGGVPARRIDRQAPF